MKIAQVEPLILNVSEKTNWFFIRVTAENGMTGLGEATLNGWETAQLTVLEPLAAALKADPSTRSCRCCRFTRIHPADWLRVPSPVPLNRP